MRQRFEIIEKVRSKGESYAVVAKSYGITKQAVGLIWKDRERYEKYRDSATYNGKLLEYSNIST